MKGYHKTKKGTMAKKGLWYNIQQKKKRIAAGSGEKMRKPLTTFFSPFTITFYLVIS